MSSAYSNVTHGVQGDYTLSVYLTSFSVEFPTLIGNPRTTNSRLHSKCKYQSYLLLMYVGY